MASSTMPARDVVCRGRVRSVVCHCRGAATRPAVFALAVVFAVIGLTGAAWGTAAIDAAGHTPSSVTAPAR